MTFTVKPFMMLIFSYILSHHQSLLIFAIKGGVYPSRAQYGTTLKVTPKPHMQMLG